MVGFGKYFIFERDSDLIYSNYVSICKAEKKEAERGQRITDVCFLKRSGGHNISKINSLNSLRTKFDGRNLQPLVAKYFAVIIKKYLKNKDYIFHTFFLFLIFNFLIFLLIF